MFDNGSTSDCNGQMEMSPGTSQRLPISALLALAMTAFVALLTEIFPAGMLLHIKQSFSISEALAGQFVTAYAFGSLVGAIPLIARTRGWPRRTLMVSALGSLILANTITALTSSFSIALAARVCAGMAGGLIWGMLVGYARRMVQDHMKGRAVAIAGVGAPIALSLGVPLATTISNEVGWRVSLGLLSVASLLIIGWVVAKVPNYPGQAAEQRTPIHRVFFIPGVRPVLAVQFMWVFAHSILYTYITPFLASAGLESNAGAILFLFGVTSVVGMWLSGLLIDRMLRPLALMSLASFALAALALCLESGSPTLVCIAIATWGVTFGNCAPLVQTASTEAAGADADVAQSILVTGWNVAIASGGLVGGLVLGAFNASTLPWLPTISLGMALLVVWKARVHGFA